MVEVSTFQVNTGLAFEDADTAWRTTVGLTLNADIVSPVTDPNSIASRFGSAHSSTREIVGHQITVLSPRARIVCSKIRRFNIGHAIAQLIWMVSGSSDGKMIGFYHRFGLQFCEADFHIPAALGARIFASDVGDQLEHVVNRLSHDPSSRRAVVQIFRPEDVAHNRRDVPCFLSVQFLVRDGALRAVGSMRSQSAFAVLPHDLFLLTMLQEVVATRLDLDIGPYTHWAASMHIYEHEFSDASAMLKERRSRRVEMPRMPRLASDWRARTIDAEADVRQKLLADIDRPIDLLQYSLDPYWSGLFAILIAVGRTENGGRVLRTDLDQVLPELKDFASQLGRDETEIPKKHVR